LHQGKRADILTDIGLTADNIAREVVATVAGLAALEHHAAYLRGQ
jgi:hypothetical protein